MSDYNNRVHFCRKLCRRVAAEYVLEWHFLGRRGYAQLCNQEVPIRVCGGAFITTSLETDLSHSVENCTLSDGGSILRKSVGLSEGRSIAASGVGRASCSSCKRISMLH